jgi:hypothetical protein
MNRKRKPNRGRDGTKSAITDVPVHCSHTAVVPVKKLRPHPRNPNRHPRQQIELLAKIIQGNGWRLPITVSNRSGYIVRGHARLEAARLAGLSHVPVDRQDYADEASELADLVADNKIAELAHLDQGMLGDIANMLHDADTDFDPALLGFDDAEFADLLIAEDVDPDIADEFTDTTGRERWKYTLHDFRIRPQAGHLDGVGMGCYSAALWEHGPSDDYKRFLEWKARPSRHKSHTAAMASTLADLISQWSRGWRGYVITVPPPGVSKDRDYPAGYLGREVAGILGVDFATVFKPWAAGKRRHHPQASLEHKDEIPEVVCRPDIPVLIVDDAVTSGTTARACLKALEGSACWFFVYINNANKRRPDDRSGDDEGSL